MDPLSLQILILKRIGLTDVLQALDHNMPANTEISIPAGTYLRRKILKILLFRLHSVSHPFIGVIIAASHVLFKYVSSFPMQCSAQMLQQHIQRLIRRFFQQRNTKALVDDSLQILNTPHIIMLLTIPGHRRTFTAPFKKSS